ncbi:D-alanyl-D-alanine carboxypeptidase family protein [Streptomyces albipurpureus]|uniref:D-alanyl-D-alanine carboxypeptidase n=1 Tax=Streptomyces albipurpureus TaxID=2897419 RepID=A0ABT0UXQ9_9ACTN|nr:serine hydrolase [Streptomyces sp. CWNU-1]MCM2393364.1 D-alanyl-D-alanine carboxypeptidase [Streptomyces sp. CWNU-1]
MAGESPDKSEQRKSSGETAHGERDPRLAMLGQVSSSGVDQPTAVFRLPEEPERRSGAERRTAGGSGVGPEPGTETGSMENDVKLRSAVAAWVASADDEQPDADAEDGDGTREAVAGAEETALIPETTVEKTALIPEVSRGDAGIASADAGADSAATDAPDAPDAAPEAGKGRQDRVPSRQDRVQSASTAKSIRPESVRAKSADTAAAADTGPSGQGAHQDPEGPEEADRGGSGAADGKGPGRSGTSGDGERAVGAASQAPVRAVPARDAVKSAKEPSEGVTAPPTDRPAAKATERPALSPPDAAAATGGSTTADPATDSDRAVAAPAVTGKGRTDGGGTASGTGEGTSAAVAKKPAGETPADASKETGKGAPSAESPSAESPKKPSASPTSDSSASAASTDAKPPIDQPTAVFLAPRKPTPAGDNATTTLKAPPAPRPETNPAPPGTGSGRPSTFVPLRSDDGPRTPTATRNETAAEPAGKQAAGGPSAGAPAAVSEPERTTQQPVPPLPPLDLLAELTNTPPPPKTAVRTVFRRVKIWTPFLALLLIVFAVVQVLRPLPQTTLGLSTDPTFTFQGGQLSLPFPAEGQGAVAVDGVGIVGTYGAQKPAPIASVAKTMTAYVILRDHPISGQQVGPKIAVDQQTEDEGKNKDESRVEVSKDQQFTQRQMLEMLMINSANNVARLLARWDAGTEQAFVKKMNDAAKQLGMTDTVYTDPSGLQATTISTPKDQLKLAQAVMKNDILRDIVNQPSLKIEGVAAPLRNGNERALLKDGVGGIKTGTSTPAGGNLLWAANTLVDGKIHQVFGMTMGVQAPKILREKGELAVTHSINVIASTQDAVTSAIAVKKGQVVGYVDDGLGGRTAVVAAKDLKAIGWAGHRIDITINDGGKKLPGSAKAGQVVGQISVGTGPGKLTAPIELQKDLVEPGFGAKLTRLG